MRLHELEVGQQKFGVLFRSTVHREIQSVSAFFDVLRNVIRIQSKRMNYEFRVVLKHLRNGVDKQFEPQCFVVFRRSNRANTNGISILQVQNRSTKDQHVPIEPVQLHMETYNVVLIDVISDVVDDCVFGSIELQQGKMLNLVISHDEIGRSSIGIFVVLLFVQLLHLIDRIVAEDVSLVEEDITMCLKRNICYNACGTGTILQMNGFYDKRWMTKGGVVADEEIGVFVAEEWEPFMGPVTVSRDTRQLVQCDIVRIRC